jgi:catechol 2,3-dioxygenase-like lactoylglutathione lyase family enzyme
MPRYTGIHHPAFATRDMDATVRFWRDLLGMRLVLAFGGPGYRQYFFEISRTAQVGFFEWPDVEGLPPRVHGTPVKGPFAFDHLAVGVEGPEDLWELVARLDAAGFHASDVIDHGFVLSVYSYDPNGIPLEFTCPSTRRDLHANPLLCDTAPPPARREGPEVFPGYWPAPEPVPADERHVFPGEGRELFA